MLYSSRYNFIFIHIGKNAGGRYRNCLNPFSDIPSNSLLNKLSRMGLQPDYRKHYFPVHTSAAYVKKIFPEDVFENAYKFAIVRNPWDRLVSLYHFLKRSEVHRHHKKASNLTFEDFVVSVLKCVKTGTNSL